MTDRKADTMADGGARRGSVPFVKEDLSGTEIAGCKLLKKLGQGAMGAVYLAEQKTLRRVVAFKVLDPKFSRDITYIERFEREAQAAARLTHHNIVQVFDYGREEDVYYIVNEYVDGGDVQALIDAEGVLDPLKGVDIIRQACEGLAVAQEEQVIHRDLKPDNLMLTKAGVVKVADFGLAKTVEDDATVTQSGMIVGTPFYMSPEQAKGLPLDLRSDIYSLGITFFHMVTGQIPFDADSVIGVLLKQISAERPDPVAVNPSLPPAVGQVILRMMAQEPEDRYQTFREIADICETLKRQFESGEPPALEVPQTPADRTQRYKLLRSSQVLALREREVQPGARDKMLDLLRSDAGVFIQTEEALAEQSVVEVRFTVPGRENIFQAIGVVRWKGEEDGRKGVGVTFLKVNALPIASTRKSSVRRKAVRPGTTKAPAVRPTRPSGRSMNAVEAIRLLTKTPLHCRLLRYHYANSGQTITSRQMASALGVGTRMLDGIINAYEETGMLVRHSDDTFELAWPEDAALQKEIVAWVTKYGLL